MLPRPGLKTLVPVVYVELEPKPGLKTLVPVVYSKINILYLVMLLSSVVTVM